MGEGGTLEAVGGRHKHPGQVASGRQDKGRGHPCPRDPVWNILLGRQGAGKCQGAQTPEEHISLHSH